MKTIYYTLCIKTILFFSSNLDIFIFDKYDRIMHKLIIALRVMIVDNLFKISQ